MKLKYDKNLIIDKLIKCVMNSDWNGCSDDDLDIDVWNYIELNEELVRRELIP